MSKFFKGFGKGEDLNEINNQNENSSFDKYQDEEEDIELSIEEKQRQSFNEFRPTINRKIKQVMAIMLALIMLLMGNLIYFQVVKAPSLKVDANNRRNAIARNKVIRGSILDRNGTVLTESKLTDDNYVRVYNGGAYTANVLGYVSEKYSVTGIERTMDSELSKDYTLTEAISKTILDRIFNNENTNEKKKGNDVVTTLDFNLQKASYEALYNPSTKSYRKGSVVAMDPKTGEILAMVSLPSFDPNELTQVMKRADSDAEYAKSAPLINRATSSLYAPGSTFKVVTLTAGLALIPGLEKETYKDTGKLTFDDGTTLSNFVGAVYGNIGMKEAFASSLNTVFGNIGLRLENADFKKVAEQFGFNKAIESKGLSVKASVFPSLTKAQQGLRALSGIGQGQVAATPVQMAMVASAIAEKGVVSVPQIIKSVTSPDGNRVYELKGETLPNSIDEKIASVTGSFMRNNVTSSQGSYAALKGIKGAGKTGTSQYTEDGKAKANAWFIGFAPYDDPKIAIAVVLEDLPDDTKSTGAVLALPIANKIMNAYLKNQN